MIIAAVQIEGLSIELFSNAEQEVIKRNLSSRLSSVKYPYKYIAVSRPVDISRALRDYEQLKNDAAGGRRKLIKAEMENEAPGKYHVRLKFGYSYLRKTDGVLNSVSDWKQQADRMQHSNKEETAEADYDL